MMKNYLVIYHMSADAMSKMSEASSDDKMESMKLWMAWKDKLGEQLVEFGSPLIPGQKINKDGSSVRSTKNVAGYSKIKADDMEAAKLLLQSHPHLDWHGGCDIEVHEFAEM